MMDLVMRVIGVRYLLLTPIKVLITILIPSSMILQVTFLSSEGGGALVAFGVGGLF